MSATHSCLIVGAGMAGLTAAGVLHENGWNVVLLDKSRGVGGRMATRRIGESRLDHGAQFFTARDARFQEAVARWESLHWVDRWFAEGGHVRYLAVGGMNALAKHLATAFDVRTESKVKLAEPLDAGWIVTTEAEDEFRADVLLLTPPAPQSSRLLEACPQLAPSVISALNDVVYDPCFALLATVDGAGRVPPPGYVRLDQGPVEWIADNTQKGISTGGAALTVHARADFSRMNFDAPKEEVAKFLLAAAAPWIGGRVADCQLHRWSYSRPVFAKRARYLFWEHPAPFLIAGDAFGGPRVEGAFLSGVAAAERIAIHYGGR